ncbi:hypothetical protein ACGFI4_29530, partial [Micromonospora carbonacea]|uniref:hypothetical protein n=1 Tax=Micromonospora carbonacea TaxID=47853 RepID=UPI00371D3401
ALLLAAVFGVLLVALPGTARIVQLRMLDRRPGRQPDGRPGPDPTPPPTTGIASGSLSPRPENRDE